MRNFHEIAEAIGIAASPEELERIVAPLEKLETVFRPLADSIPVNVEPAVLFRAAGDEQ